MKETVFIVGWRMKLSTSCRQDSSTKDCLKDQFHKLDNTWSNRDNLKEINNKISNNPNNLCHEQIALALKLIHYRFRYNYKYSLKTCSQLMGSRFLYPYKILSLPILELEQEEEEAE